MEAVRQNTQAVLSSAHYYCVVRKRPGFALRLLYDSADEAYESKSRSLFARQVVTGRAI
jgi:hypothetical protein